MIVNPAGSDGEIAKTRVPAIPDEVYAEVGVMALPTDALTTWAAGVRLVLAEAIEAPSPTATETDNVAMTTSADDKRFMGASWGVP